MEDLLQKTANDILLRPEISLAIVRNSPDGILVVNDTGTIIFVNKESQLIFGYHYNEMLNQKLEMLLPEVLRSKHEGHRKEYVNDPRPRHMGHGMDLKALKKNGEEINVTIQLAPEMFADIGQVTIAYIRRKK